MIFNGVNGATGDYLLSLSREQLLRVAQGEPLDDAEQAELRYKHQLATEAHLGPAEGIDPRKLEEAGWGIIFAYSADAAVREALSELLNMRREQAGDYYREYMAADGYRPNETKQAFLARHGAGPGPADPRRVPYYLLIVGDPEAIPYQFQYQLGCPVPVGRVYFDTLEEYAQYARSVVTAERESIGRPRRAVFFGPRNPDDQPTTLSASQLVDPLADWLKDSHQQWKNVGTWEVKKVLAAEATRARLSTLLGGEETPALLFTASHGMGFPKGHPLQMAHQGALLCQDWPGREQWRNPIPRISTSPAITSVTTLGCWACWRSTSLATEPARPGSTTSRTRSSARRGRLPIAHSWPPYRDGCLDIRRVALWRSSATWSGPGATRSCGMGRDRNARCSRVRSDGCSAVTLSARRWSISIPATRSSPSI